MSTDTMSDVLVKTTDLPWVPLAEGIDYRILRTSPETGTWTVLLRAQAGSSSPNTGIWVRASIS